MNTQLLGLELSLALSELARQGVEPVVVQTRAPRRPGEEGVLRVVYASQDGSHLTVSRFLDPLSEA